MACRSVDPEKEEGEGEKKVNMWCQATEARSSPALVEVQGREARKIRHGTYMMMVLAAAASKR